jgi:hypothetical protein
MATASGAAKESNAPIAVEAQLVYVGMDSAGGSIEHGT